MDADLDIIEVLRSTMWRRTDDEERRFIAAIDAIKPPVSVDLTRALFDTFLPIEDYGTQESVVRVLCLVDEGCYFDILAEKIISIIDRSPDWAVDLINRAALFNPAPFNTMMAEMTTQRKRAVSSFIERELPGLKRPWQDE